MIVKVCGIMDSNQYQKLSKLEVDMIGFNFYPKSKRFLKTPIALDTVSTLANVGVFVNPSRMEVAETVKLHNLEYIQLHGNESVEFCQILAQDHKIIKVFGIDEAFDFSVTTPYEQYVSYFLFDTKTPLFGGSGKKFAWDKLNQYSGNIDFFLSGGIAPADVNAILELKHQRFVGLDINSGFETSPGYKDIELISSFLNKVKYEEPR